MNSLPQIGTSGELQFVVEQKHVIDFCQRGNVESTAPVNRSTAGFLAVYIRASLKSQK
jgi:hypothetical protein